MTQTTIGHLIREARLTKSRRLHAELAKREPDAAARISPDKMYTQVDLAKDGGVAQSQISAYESGKVEPELLTLRKLATALGVPLSGLIGE